MQKSEWISMNGELVRWEDSKVHILTHALQYGTGVFEGIRSFKTHHGGGATIFRLHDHLARLFDSASIYLMNMPYDFNQVAEFVKEVVRANGLDDCYIRPLAYYGAGEMGTNPLPNKVNLAIASWRWDSYLGEEAEKKGARCQVSSWRRIHSSSMPPQAKSTANYANASLAKIEALKAGYDESMLLNMNGMVAEATAENIFRVRDGVLSTPPASDGALRGITRDTVIHIANDFGIEFRRNEISREELYTSAELFLTSTAAGVTSIREVDGRRIGNGQFPIMERIRHAYSEIVSGRNHKYLKWLEPVQKKETVPKQVPAA
jgi:branched-chain amino acid aminotransferase